MREIMGEFDLMTPDSWLLSEESNIEKLNKLSDWSQIPLINSNASHNLPDGSLVRFRGMIQDMHNPEFYFERFEVFNSVSNEVTTRSGKYRDTANIMENEKINYSTNFQSAERHTMIVVSMPGLNEWAQNKEDLQNHLHHLNNHPNTSKRFVMETSTKLKRSIEDDDSMEVENSEASNSNKISKSDQTNGAVEPPPVSQEHLLNFPLPDVMSKSCIVKVYKESDKLKLNEMIEAVGFLSVDPCLSGEFAQDENSLLTDIESKAETLTHNPPPSLVPRLHAVHIKKLNHSNPLIGESDKDSILREAPAAREHLLKALKELLLGDELAAEYLICHLVSCVYLRQETLTLGQFCLNLSNLPITKYPNYAKQLYDIIKQFVTKSYYLPMTVDNLNSMAFQPKKDYECNRLTSGILQLCKNTHLVLDETQMENGQLGAAGVQNITALGNLIKTQKVEYDFKYYKMDFDSDVSVLILSEGKSLLPSDYLVPMRPEASSLEIFNAIVEAANYYLKEDIMNIIRRYLTNIKLVKYTISENLQFVEDDFIKMRSESTEEDPVTADDLHRLLVLARLVSLSRGYDSLGKDCWEIAKSMEIERRYRVKNRTPVAF